jgi:hypothetical protein
VNRRLGFVGSMLFDVSVTIAITMYWPEPAGGVHV